MILEYWKQLLITAILLMLFGCVMPFLMTIRVVQSTLFWNFLSFGASVLGLFLGLAGIAGMRVERKHRTDREDRYK